MKGTIIKKTALSATLLAVLGTGGACTMAPTYERPESPIPSSFPHYPEYKGVGADKASWQSAGSVRPGGAGDSGQEIEKAGDETPAPGNQPWSEFFADPGMNKVISLALENNRDLRVAMLNIDKARATYQIQRADLLPSVNVTGANSNQLTPAEFVPMSNDASISRQTSLSVGISSWELDLWGRVRSLKDAALEQFFATTQNAHATQISLVAEVASVYLQLVSYNELYDLAESTYQSRKESLEMVQSLTEIGLASQLTLNQARTALEEARVSAVQMQTACLQYRNALSMLMGMPIPADMEIPRSLKNVRKLPDLPAGMPSYLLERRPDILAAEHTLKSANANIGAARANFFPRISLTTSIGTMSADVDNLFESASKTWTFAPQAVLPIFQGGRLIAGLEVSHVDKEIAVANYEKAIQNAFREVADAMAQRSTITEQINATTSLMMASQESYDLSNIRYEVGLDSFLNVLDAQRMLFSSQQGVINTLLQREINSLNLYKALGGGWH